MVPPGVDLTVVLYACLRLGAVVVVADAGLGTTRTEPRREGRRPGLPHRHRQGAGGCRGTRLVGTAHQCAGPAGRPAAASSASKPPSPALARRGAGLSPEPPSRLRTRPGLRPTRTPRCRRALHLRLHRPGQGRAVHAPAAGRDARHRGRDAAGSARAPRLVAGFAPFALLGPALGASLGDARTWTSPCPATLTARALADAAAAIDATVIFASPAALRQRPCDRRAA